jgi:hypothetical protein
MAPHIFQLKSELQNIPETAPEASRSFSVSEKLARYGSSALSGVEHLTLLVGRKSVAIALIRHFGSLKGLARASLQELRQLLPRRQAESVVAALSMSVMAETERTRSEQLDNPESIYRAWADMNLFNQEVCFMTCAHHGIGAEIARAALAVGTSLPTQTSAASWPSPKGESHRWPVDLVTAPSMEDVEPRQLPSVAFTPSGPLVYQWRKNSSEAFCRP